MAGLKTILSIAGSDPTGGAGIQADIRCGNSLGLHVLTAVTAVTAQNSKGLYELGVVCSSLLESQLQSILKDVTPNAVKIGIIGSEENFSVVERFLSNLSDSIPVVVDPLLKSTAGKEDFNLGLKDIDKVRDLYVNKIFPYCKVATPNIEEASLLFGKTIKNEDHNILLNSLRLNNLILTGLNIEDGKITDVLIEQKEITTSTHLRIDCNNLHGTGCCFSSFIASYMAMGKTLKDSFLLASERIFKIINNSNGYTLGHSSYGPLNINNYKL